MGHYGVVPLSRLVVTSRPLIVTNLGWGRECVDLRRYRCVGTRRFSSSCPPKVNSHRDEPPLPRL